MSINQKIEPASIPYFFRLLHGNAVVYSDLEKAWGIVVSTVPLCPLRSWGWSPGTTGPFCLELGCSVFLHHQKTSYRLKLNIGKDFYRYCFLLFNKQPFVCVQTSRKPAEDRRVFSESDAPDEVHVCGLLFQSSICSQCTHTAQVKKCSCNERHKKCEEKIPRTNAILPKHSNMFYVCVTVKNWGSTWSQRGHPVQGSWLWPPVWVNPSPDWRDTLHCWKNWTGTCRLTFSHLLPKVINSQMPIIIILSNFLTLEIYENIR